MFQTNVQPATPSFTFPDGVYQLKPVFVTGTGGTSTGPYFMYTVDSIRPAVVAVAFGGDANHDGKLNGMELATGSPIANITFMGVEDGRMVTVINTADGTTAGSATVSGNAAAVTLSGLSLTATTTATFNLEVRVTDAVGNPNNQSGATPANAINPAAFVTLGINRVAPTCTLALPNRTQLGIADDADMATAGYQLRTSVNTSADVTSSTGVSIALTGGSGPTSSAGAPTAGAYTHDFTVSSAGAVTYTVTPTCTDDAGNVTTGAAFMVTVDNVAPTCMITAPTAGSYSNPAITTTISTTNADGLTPSVSTTSAAACSWGTSRSSRRTRRPV